MMSVLIDITKTSSRMAVVCGLSCLVFPLAGCNLYEEGHMTTKRVQVQEKNFSDDVLVSNVDDAYIEALASHFYKYGGGTMDVTVTYDPYSRSNTAMLAGDKASEIVAAFRAAGVNSLKGGVLPVRDQGDFSHLLVSYSAYTAHAPEGCGDLSGIEGVARDLEYNPDYEFGCSTQNLMAKQIARPKDLLGQGNTDHLTDARAAGNIVDTYRSGAQNKSLDGETASDQ